MRILASLGAVALFFTSATLAQTAPAPPPMKLFAASAEIPKLIEQARATAKPDQPLLALPILSLAPYRANLEYRPGNGPPAVHEKDAEMFYVIEGTATLITGGKLEGEERTNAANLRGKSISGGQSQAIAKGDFFIVAENTPHQVIPTGGAPVVLMSIHVPRPAANWP